MLSVLERTKKRREETAGVAQLVERKPSKLDVAGSSPVSRSDLVGRSTALRNRSTDVDVRVC